MIEEFTSLFEFSSNVYLLTKFKHALIVDLGSFSHSLNEKLKDYTLDAILLTHGHFDHINGINKLPKIYQKTPIYCNEEADFLLNPKKNGSLDFHQEVSIKNKFNYLNEGKHQIGPFEFYVYLTPGHTEGGVIYYFPNEKAIFFGDTVLGESYGRYDLYSGSYTKLKKSLDKIKFLRFQDDDICYFGHGEKISYKNLKKINPYI